MKRLSADALRERYLAFFESKGHQRQPGASLVPHGDPTLLLTSAGMVPFKPFFLGKERPAHRRLTTCQRCIRTPDIDHVGHTDRHATFFEMLGNFSFGDYFKAEAIEWAWEFVTTHLDLDPQALWVTIYQDDDEAFALWRDRIGVPAERIVRLGRDDNFWEIGVGPCGPCSEIFVDRGGGCGQPDCRPGCERCERFFEIWNLVFIQYDQDADGNLTPLRQTGIDTGMGLERTAAFLQGVDSIFEIDTIRPIVDYVAQAAGTHYGESPEKDVSLRVITDHMRGVALMVMDGVLPGNEGRGYVLRRLLRRAARHARLLGIEDAFLVSVAERVRDKLGAEYPQLRNGFQSIARVIALEEQRFHETLDQGIDLLNRLIQSLRRDGVETVPGDEAFRLYDTYGFPLELTEEIAASHGLAVDRAAFDRAMQRQREKARAARADTGYLGDEAATAIELLDLPATKFLGYTDLESEGRIAALLVNGTPLQEAEAAADVRVEVVLDQTPFYPESGGQVADTGSLAGKAGLFAIDEVQRLAGGVIVHRGRLVSGTMRVGEAVLATVDAHARRDTERNHTGTHLLHKVLHEVLGDHANQAGSLVAPDRLRFDFTHFEPVSKEQRIAIERQVNERIYENLPLSAQEMGFDEAREMGAMALFGEKYGDRVRVVSIGDFSMELCGGTHVRSSGEIGLFKIVSETGVASGVRRIEAVTGYGAHRFVLQEEDALASAAERLQVAPLEVPHQLDRLQQQMKALEREVARLKGRLFAAQSGELAATAHEVGGLRVLAAQVDGADMEGLRTLGDTLRDRLQECVIVLGSTGGGKVQLVAMASKEAVARGVKANDIVRRIAPIIGGGGGGHAEMAQAGGRKPEQLSAAIAKAAELLKAEVLS